MSTGLGAADFALVVGADAVHFVAQSRDGTLYPFGVRDLQRSLQMNKLGFHRPPLAEAEELEELDNLPGKVLLLQITDT